MNKNYPIFQKRTLRVIITVGNGLYGDSPGASYQYDNLRVLSTIRAYGGQTQGQAVFQVFGMKIEDMNMLTTTAFVKPEIRLGNSIQVLAVDEDGNAESVYYGFIDMAFVNYDSAPDVSMEIQALSAAKAARMPANPTVISSPCIVQNVISLISRQLGFSFVNNSRNSVNVTINDDITLDGSMLDRLYELAHMANIDLVIDDRALIPVVKIKYKYDYFSDTTPVITPRPLLAAGQIQLVGYPELESGGIRFKMLYSNQITLGIKVTLKDSIVPFANADWITYSVAHELDSFVPQGRWYTTVEGYPSELYSK